MKTDGVVLATGPDPFLGHACDFTMLGHWDGSFHGARAFYLYGSFVDGLRGSQMCGRIGEETRHGMGQVRALLGEAGGLRCRAGLVERQESQGPR